jgi:cytosine/adenosine deaminase-related metal-dependent hydrolase
MSTKLIYGKYLVADAETVIPSGALFVQDEKIVDVGTYDRISREHKAQQTLGSSETLIVPGLVNAHGHGKGITDFQRGQIDDTLETWKWRAFPPVDPYYDTLWAAISLIENGVTTTMHNHGLVNPGAYEEEFTRLLEAYSAAGIRVALAPTLNTENVFVYGDNEAFIDSLSPELQELCRRISKNMARFGEAEYFDAVETLHRKYSSGKVHVLHGPLSPQWVRKEALLEIKKHALERGMRIHIHTQQTQLQYHYGLKRYGKSLLAHLAELGFLGPDVTCGHCVWLSQEDIGVLVRTEASATHHPACNLRVRNGISPVFELVRKGVRVGLGMDEKEFADDKDYIAEMRLAAELHRLPSHRLDSDHLLPAEVFKMGTENGAEVLGFGDAIGTLQKGKQADIVLVDLQRICEPFMYAGHHPLDMLLYRGQGRDVRTVLAGGKVLLEEGKLTQIDRDEVIRKLRESIPADYEEGFARSNALFPQLRTALAAHAEPSYQEIQRWEKNPYYFLNNRF